MTQPKNFQTSELYLSAYRDALNLPDDQFVTTSLIMALAELCALREFCDDPWDCPLRWMCLKGAKIRRWRQQEVGLRIIGGMDEIHRPMSCDPPEGDES